MRDLVLDARLQHGSDSLEFGDDNGSHAPEEHAVKADDETVDVKHGQYAECHI